MVVMNMKPTQERRLSIAGFPDQKKVYPVPCSWMFSSPGKRTSPRRQCRYLTWKVHVRSELSDLQVGFRELHQAWF